MVEVSAIGVTKGSALERVARSHAVGAQDVIAFGDMPNDLPMLTWAGRGVAMVNGHPAVRAAAYDVDRGEQRGRRRGRLPGAPLPLLTLHQTTTPPPTPRARSAAAAMKPSRVPM